MAEDDDDIVDMSMLEEDMHGAYMELMDASIDELMDEDDIMLENAAQSTDELIMSIAELEEDASCARVGMAAAANAPATSSAPMIKSSFFKAGLAEVGCLRAEHYGSSDFPPIHMRSQMGTAL